jgi:hypothetical protein
MPSKLKVAGSNPAGVANEINYLNMIPQGGETPKKMRGVTQGVTHAVNQNALKTQTLMDLNRLAVFSRSRAKNRMRSAGVARRPRRLKGDLPGAGDEQAHEGQGRSRLPRPKPRSRRQKKPQRRRGTRIAEQSKLSTDRAKFAGAPLPAVNSGEPSIIHNYSADRPLPAGIFSCREIAVQPNGTFEEVNFPRGIARWIPNFRRWAFRARQKRRARSAKLKQ